MPTTADSHPPIPVRTPDPATWHGEGPRADQRIRELAGYRLARLEAEVLTPARGIPSADQRLRRMVAAYVTLAISDPGIMPLVSGAQKPGEDAPPLASSGIARFTSSLQKALSEVLEKQDPSPRIAPEVAVQSLLGIIHWGVSCHRAEERLSREEATAQITFLALHGLIPQSRTGPTRPQGPARPTPSFGLNQPAADY